MQDEQAGGGMPAYRVIQKGRIVNIGVNDLESLVTHHPDANANATNYVRAFPNQIREFVPARFTVLGTDGFGRSDTRANLRRHLEVDRFHIAHAAIAALAADGKVTGKDVARAIRQYKLDGDKPNPLGV